MKFLITSILIFTLVSSYGQSTVNKTISLDPYLSFQNYEHFKRLTLSSPNSPIEYLDGFDFSWGYQYELNISETKLAESLSDGSSYLYALNDIISKIKVPDSTRFNLYLDPNRYYYKVEPDEQDMNSTFKQLNDSTYLYFDEVEIVVPTYLKEEFDAILNGEHGKLGRFIFIDDKKIKLLHL
jgi:hypothetical protein